MLAVTGKASVDELFSTIPDSVRFRGELNIPGPVSEAQLMRHLEELSKKNVGAGYLSFLGCGMYAHHIPPAVDQLLLRSEFYTAYTPYQPEVAQGTLQAIFEFQTMVSELYGLPLSNASLYDGASATAEAALMARRLTGRSRILCCESVHPEYRATTSAYLSENAERDLTVVGFLESGAPNVSRLVETLSDDVAAIVVGYPSYVGPLADLRALADACHARGALLIAAVIEPYALSVAMPPGHMGADIVVGEGQPLAVPPQFGGPGVGLFACRDDRKFLQQLPGRVCGETVDHRGKRGYVLTLSTREQHIRRERATSNICTNQGLIALAFAIRVSLLGKTGFVEVGQQCLAKARYLEAALVSIPGVSRAFGGAPFFNEFAVEFEGVRAETVLRLLETKGILGGVDLGRFRPADDKKLLVAVTENHTKEDMDRFVAAVRACLGG